MAFRETFGRRHGGVGPAGFRSVVGDPFQDELMYEQPAGLSDRPFVPAPSAKKRYFSRRPSQKRLAVQHPCAVSTVPKESACWSAPPAPAKRCCANCWPSSFAGDSASFCWLAAHLRNCCRRCYSNSDCRIAAWKKVTAAGSFRLCSQPRAARCRPGVIVDERTHAAAAVA